MHPSPRVMQDPWQSARLPCGRNGERRRIAHRRASRVTYSLREPLQFRGSFVWRVRELRRESASLIRE